MNFGGGPELLQFLFILLLWGLPLVLLVWFVRTLTAMAARLSDIVVRLESLERTIRDATRSAPPNVR